ncbi:MFS transporter [Glycomyces arizonensis]|uniref:MFS transporter n=1 Tax=Glycomyces arizonensis TaxID=256035 RepID=UPI000478C1C1|nr:MFS transporter [Glycomyces arizonensis]
MTTRTLHRPTAIERRARIAVAALFLTNGALAANLAPRFPDLKAAFELDNTAFGLAMATWPAGAVTAGLASAFLIRRFGSAYTATIGTAFTALCYFVAVIAPSPIALGAILFVGGAVDTITDTAQNAHGLRIQRRYGRSIINSFHALWSVGAITGGLMAAGAIALDLSLGVHFGIVAALFATMGLAALPYCLRGPDRDGAPEDDAAQQSDEEQPKSRFNARTALTLAAVGIFAFGGILMEGTSMSWSTLYLADELHAPAAIAASGYIAMVSAQFLARLAGDRLVDRFGQRTVARAGGLLAAVGMGAALAFPNVAGTIVGFTLVGLGVATLVPAARQTADSLPGLRPGTGLTALGWLMNLSFLVSPPIIGAVADAASLRAGLLAIPVAGVLVAVFAGVLQRKR